MVNYSDHSKLVFKNYDEIQRLVNDHELDAWDIVISADTKEFILIREDLSLFPIKSKLYRFLDVQSAEDALNASYDTYEGQLVAIAVGNRYEAYIVNKDATDRFIVSPIATSGMDIDYNVLMNRPIINMAGDIGNPVMIDELNNGLYKVQGQYRISAALSTIFQSYESMLFLVRHEGETTYIKRISVHDITDYKVSGGLVTRSSMPTIQWIEEQGYATEFYVDNKMANLNFLTMQDLERYFQSVVTNTIDQKIDDLINLKFEEASMKDIMNLFSKN